MPRTRMPATNALLYPAHLHRIELGDRFLTWLGWVLLGYALLGRGFAYLGVAPLYIGEITALFGILALVSTRIVGRVVRLPLLQLLIAFMLWGAVCTIPHLPTYGMLALRDAALWGYGCFAIIVAGLLVQRPDRLKLLLLRYRRFAVIVAGLAWFMLVLKGYGGSLPKVPGSTVPIIAPKTGDLAVHVAGVATFLLVGMARPNLVLVGLIVLTPLLGNRAGMLSFAVVLLVAALLTPFKGKLARLIYLGCCALVAFALFMPTITIGNKSVSTELLWTKMESIFTETESSRYNNTKEWRLEWWQDIIDYTVHGPHFWTGKGYGINLSVDDGYKSGAEEALRSPHNGHMTVLARSGVPGFVLWVLLHVGWLYSMLAHYFRSRRVGDRTWMAIFTFLTAYWAGMMTNACFDVVLESPMGGIWMWTLFGIGVAAMHIHTHSPEVIALPEVVSPSPLPDLQEA